MSDSQAEKQGKRRDGFEIDDCNQSDFPDLLQVGHFRETDGDRQKHDGRDHHADQLDEQVADEFQFGAKLWIGLADNSAQNQPDENLDVDLATE
ncbi:hypothetical protein ABIE85_001099 [Bradyrhizobium diazoefficiens]